MNVLRKLWRGATGFLERGALAAVLVAVGVGPAQADTNTLAQRRQAALSELRQFFNQDVQIQASLVTQKGPEWWQEMFGKSVFGCPLTSSLDISDRLSLIFTTGGPGQWAGDFDGVNVGTRKATGDVGLGLAVPKSSLISNGQMHLQFSFDDRFNVRRKLIDAAAEKFDECARKLPPGDYGPNGLAEACPIPEVTREQAGQTCIESTDGRIVARNTDGTYNVSLNRTLSCDFVSYAKPGPGSSVFVGCYFARYEGKATLSAPNSSAAVSNLKRAAKRVQQRCARVKANSVNQCVAREMSRQMARRR